MSLPTVRINTFVKENEKPYVDPLSKIYIILEIMLGLDRMPLLGREKLVYVLISSIIFLSHNCLMIFAMVHDNDIIPINFMMVVVVTENVIVSLLSYTRCKWMVSYYSELNKFDAEAACRPKVSAGCIRNVVMMVISCVLILTLFILPLEIGILTYSPLYAQTIYFVYVIEVYYFGHLLSLLTPRLKLINYYIESSLSNTLSESKPALKEFVYFKSYDPKIAQGQMRKLMDLYQIVVEAYDCLIEGIKWQFLVIIITAFLAVLGLLYDFSLDAIRSPQIFKEDSVFELGTSVILMAPLFAPCMFGDSVHSEVKKLRELLASRLYENKLDKSGRSVARALLAFTETRDLSFRLLRMLNIDISLPFKFVGLLVTYLIIMLQFEKVINP